MGKGKDRWRSGRRQKFVVCSVCGWLTCWVKQTIFDSSRAYHFNPNTHMHLSTFYWDLQLQHSRKFKVSFLHSSTTFELTPAMRTSVAEVSKRNKTAGPSTCKLCMLTRAAKTRGPCQHGNEDVTRSGQSEAVGHSYSY